MFKYLDPNGLLYIWNKIKVALGGKVDKAEGKTLTTNDLTNALKTQYDGAVTHAASAHAPVGAQVNVIETVKVNGAAQAVDQKAVNIVVPTKVSDLSNDAGFATKTEVNTAIASAGHITRTVVDALPELADADERTIYMVRKAGVEAGNQYTEYMVIGGAWEQLGDTAVDLSGYVKTSDLVPITNAEIDGVVGA